LLKPNLEKNISQQRVNREIWSSEVFF